MPKYNASQSGLLIRLAAAHARVSLSMDGMETLAVYLEEAVQGQSQKKEWSGRYLRDRLSLSVKGKEAEFSEERADILARYAGFEGFAEFQSHYLSLSTLLAKGAYPETPVYLIHKDLFSHYQDELSPVLNILDKTVPAYRTYTPREENSFLGEISREENGGVGIATLKELKSMNPAGEEVRQKWFVLAHPPAENPTSIDWPSERVISSALHLRMLTFLLCLPELLAVKTDTGTTEGHTISGTVNGTVFQGAVNIRQNNHSTGQQFVTSSDVHITNNNHYNHKP